MDNESLLMLNEKTYPEKLSNRSFGFTVYYIKIFIKFALVIFMEYRLEIGIVDSGVLSDNFIEFYYSELQISGRVFDSSIGYTILISKRPISSYVKINYSLQS